MNFDFEISKVDCNNVGRKSHLKSRGQFLSVDGREAFLNNIPIVID